MDKNILPSVMHLRKGQFGRAGRTKWTHLTDQDTTAAKEDDYTLDQGIRDKCALGILGDTDTDTERTRIRIGYGGCVRGGCFSAFSVPAACRFCAASSFVLSNCNHTQATLLTALPLSITPPSLLWLLKFGSLRQTTPRWLPRTSRWRSPRRCADSSRGCCASPAR